MAMAMVLESQTYAGLEGLNVLISRMNIEKTYIVFEKEKEFEVLNQRVVEYWTGTLEFEGQRFQRSGPSKKGVRDKLCDKMIQVINDMETFTGKKKKTKRGNGKARDKRKNLGKREKLIKRLALRGIGTKLCPGCKWKNFTKYPTCLKCKSDISGVKASGFL